MLTSDPSWTHNSSSEPVKRQHGEDSFTSLLIICCENITFVDHKLKNFESILSEKKWLSEKMFAPQCITVCITKTYRYSLNLFTGSSLLYNYRYGNKKCL